MGTIDISELPEWEQQCRALAARPASDFTDVAELANYTLQLLAEIDELREHEEGLHQLTQNQARILSATAIALRGPQPPLTLWSHHDVAELATAAVARAEAAELKLATILAWADRSMPKLINIEAIRRIIDEGKEAANV